MFFEDFQEQGIFRNTNMLKNLFIHCIHILDVATVHHKEVYTKLLTNITNDNLNESSIQRASKGTS